MDVDSTESEAVSPKAQEVTTPFRAGLFSLALTMLLPSLGTSIPNVALPTLAQVFAVSVPVVQWVVIGYLLAMTVLVVSVGRLGDMWGRRRVLTIGIVLFTLASFLCAIASSFWFLVASRALHGFGAAILMALTIAMVRETVPEDRTGRAMGLLGTMSAVGTALGPSLGGVLVASAGWPAIFASMVPLGLLSLLMVHRYLPDHDEETVISPGAFDSVGTLLLSLMLVIYALAVTLVESQPDWRNIALLLVVPFLAGLFWVTERRAEYPLIQPAAIHSRTLAVGLSMNMLVSTVMMATLVVGPFYLAHGLGLTEALVGLVMSAGPVMSVLTGYPSGRLVDRFGASSIVISGIVVMAVGAILLVVVPAGFGPFGYVAALLVLTPGYQLFQAANNTTVMMDIQPEQRGVTSGMLSLSRNLGLITGASVMGAVFAYLVGGGGVTQAAPEAIISAMQTTFAIATALIIIAAAIAAVGHGRSNGLMRR